MNNEVVFSIIIPTYNRAHLISNTIQSVLNQDYNDYELIIVDDGSTDNTEEIALSYKNKNVYYYKKENGERGAARNYGRVKARGKYVTFFDSDDILHSNHLSVAETVIKQKNNPEWFHLGYNVINENKVQISTLKESISNPNCKLIEGNYLSCNGVFLRKDIADEFQFNEDRKLSALEDWELWLRIASKYKLHLNPTITSSIINHNSRSVLVTHKDSLLSRFDTFLALVLSNENVIKYYKGKIFLLKSSCYSYISLHLALSKKHKKESLFYLYKAIITNPLSIFKRRFLAIIKNLIL